MQKESQCESRETESLFVGRCVETHSGKGNQIGSHLHNLIESIKIFLQSHAKYAKSEVEEEQARQEAKIESGERGNEVAHRGTEGTG